MADALVAGFFDCIKGRLLNARIILDYYNTAALACGQLDKCLSGRVRWVTDGSYNNLSGT